MIRPAHEAPIHTRPTAAHHSRGSAIQTAHDAQDYTQSVGPRVRWRVGTVPTRQRTLPYERLTIATLRSPSYNSNVAPDRSSASGAVSIRNLAVPMDGLPSSEGGRSKSKTTVQAPFGQSVLSLGNLAIVMYRFPFGISDRPPSSLESQVTAARCVLIS